MSRKDRRAQITIFIILGIIILMTVALFIILRERTTIFKPERVVPPEIAPMNRFISTCLETVSREGLMILGNNGGFIKIPREISLDPFSYLSITPLFPEIKTPLWYYNHENRMPAEEYMKNELAIYIEENLDSCLEGLGPFREQFTIVELANKSITVDLQDRATIITLEWPLEIQITQINQTTKIEGFTAEMPIRLKRAYEMAKTVMEKAVFDKFIEVKTLTLIDIDTQIPFTDMAFTCSPKIWFVEDIRSRLGDLLAINIPHVKVSRTDFAPISEDEKPFEYNHFIWDVIPYTSDLKIGFTYDKKWPLSLAVRPSQGGVLKSNAQQGQDMMSLFCMHLWHFTYDVKYPVLISIRDEMASGHDEYTFNFGMQIDVNHNAPARAPMSTTIFDFEQTPSASEFCNNNLANTISVFTYENITSELGSSYNPLNDVKITYTCIRYACEIGDSKYVGGGAEAVYGGVFPYCINGVLRGEKDGYIKAQTFLTTNENKDARLYLTPTADREYKVVKHFQSDPRSGIGAEEELEDGESAYITLKIKNPELESFGDYPGFDEYTQPLKFLAKADYTYELKIWLIEGDKIIGGYEGNWTVPWDELASARQIKFHVVEMPYNPDEVGQYIAITTLGERSKSLPKSEFI